MIRRTSLLSLFASLLLVAAAAVAAPLTPHDIARVRSVTQIALSPDGSDVAFALSVPRKPFEDEEGAAWTELHVARGASEPRAFVSGDVNVSAIDWRPRTGTITFLAKRGKDEFRNLYEISRDGGEARRIVTHTTDITSYSWSPDGNRVAFIAKDPQSDEQKAIEKKGFRVEVFEETAKPAKLWVADLSAADTKAKAITIDGSGSMLRWAPQGSRVAIAIAPTSGTDDEYMHRTVTIVDVDAGRVVATVKREGKLDDIVWSPAARYLALLSGRDINDPAAGTLLIANADGSNITQLLRDYEGHVSDIEWRDEETMLVLGDEGTLTHVYELSRDGARKRTIVAPGETVFTSLQAEGQRLAMIGESSRHPSELFVATRAATPVRVTSSNPWLAQRAFARQETVRYKARDGVEVEGVLVRPLNEVAGKRYPLILTVHGGPEAHYRNGWLTSYSNPGHLAASRGFAVFYPNYRGSTGRGHAFATMSQADAAGKEFNDLVDGVDHLIATGLVDKAKVGITGGSYGGFATAWGATYYSERFAAAVMFVGISDLISKWATTEIPEEEFLVHARKNVWEDWKFYRERSPIFYADRSKTPTLILHGKDDPRVHPSQSLMLYRHLQARGKAPVRMVLYPGEGHGNRKAGARLDYNLRMLQWFEHYLQGAGGAMPSYELKYEEAK